VIDDGFLRGVNLPWLRYGCDFGASSWFPDGGLASERDRDRLRERLDALAPLALDVVRWFVLCDGRSGLRERGDGLPAGIDACLLEDLAVAVDEVERAGLRLIPVLIDFHWALPAQRIGGTQLGGRVDVLRDPRGREALVECVFRPLFETFGRHAAIAAWDLFNEPEWITLGVGRWSPRGALDAADVRALLRDSARLAHEITRHPVTAGSASPAWLDLVTGVGLDFYAPHWYATAGPSWPIERHIGSLGLDRPAVLGEFAASGAEDEARITAVARAAGYAGALAWRSPES